MPRVLCTLPNASIQINSVDFEKTKEGMLSEDIADDVAANFLLIDGFVEYVDPPAAAAKVDGDGSGDANKESGVSGDLTIDPPAAAAKKPKP
jgi:hypothetical protein